MLIEVKVKVSRNIDGKIRKKTETYLVDKEFFAEAEYKVTHELSEEQNSQAVESFEIVSLRQSAVKEIASQYEGDFSFIASFKDIFLDNDGTEKPIKYKVLLWANDLSEAMEHVTELARQGYDMTVEGLKEVDCVYLEEDDDDSGNHEE